MKKWICFMSVLALCVLMGCEDAQSVSASVEARTEPETEIEMTLPVTETAQEETETAFASEDGSKDSGDTQIQMETECWIADNIRTDNEQAESEERMETEMQEESSAQKKAKVQTQAQAEAKAQAEAEAQAQAEAAQETGQAVTEISRMYVEDCGQDSGYWVITYSDGRVEYIDD